MKDIKYFKFIFISFFLVLFNCSNEAKKKVRFNDVVECIFYDPNQVVVNSVEDDTKTSIDNLQGNSSLNNSDQSWAYKPNRNTVVVSVRDCSIDEEKDTEHHVCEDGQSPISEEPKSTSPSKFRLILMKARWIFASLVAFPMELLRWLWF